jgi:hypothetical protein
VPALIFKWRSIVALCLVSYGLGYSRVPVLSITASALRGALAAVENTQAGYSQAQQSPFLSPSHGQQGVLDGRYRYLAP